MKHFRKILAIAFCLVLGLSAAGCGKQEEGGGETPPPDYQPQVDAALSELSDEQFTLAQISGTDALGRKVLPTVGMNGKYVGLFYFVHTGYHYNKIHDNSKILAEYPDRTLMTSPLTAIPTGPTAD